MNGPTHPTPKDEGQYEEGKPLIQGKPIWPEPGTGMTNEEESRKNNTTSTKIIDQSRFIDTTNTNGLQIPTLKDEGQYEPKEEGKPTTQGKPTRPEYEPTAAGTPANLHKPTRAQVQAPKKQGRTPLNPDAPNFVPGVSCYIPQNTDNEKEINRHETGDSENYKQKTEGKH